jgi:hypothetical protein
MAVRAITLCSRIGAIYRPQRIWKSWEPGIGKDDFGAVDAMDAELASFDDARSSKL